jgi:hypothetical protein
MLVRDDIDGRLIVDCGPGDAELSVWTFPDEKAGAKGPFAGALRRSAESSLTYVLNGVILVP